MEGVRASAWRCLAIVMSTAHTTKVRVVTAPSNYSRKAISQYIFDAIPPAKKLAAPGDSSHEVPFQVANHLLKISKPARSAASAISQLTSKHGRKTRPVHEARPQAAPHAGDALRLHSLLDDVDRAAELPRRALGLYELELELGLDRLGGVGDGCAERERCLG